MQFSTRRTNFYTLQLFITFDAWTTTLHLSEIRTSYSILGVCRKSSRHISYFHILLLGILGGSVLPGFLQILTLFQTKKYIIFHTRFQNWPLGRNGVVIDLSTNKKILQIHFGIERINTFVHSHSSLKTILDSRPKWAKRIPVFRPKRHRNPTRWGSTLPI